MVAAHLSSLQMMVLHKPVRSWGSPNIPSWIGDWDRALVVIPLSLWGHCQFTVAGEEKCYFLQGFSHWQGAHVPVNNPLPKLIQANLFKQVSDKKINKERRLPWKRDVCRGGGGTRR